MDDPIDITGRWLDRFTSAVADGTDDAMAAGGIAFLCSPWSDYVTGQVLNVTGGLAMGMDH